MTDLALAFGAGLLGGVHCAGMCGGFVLVAAAGGRRGWLFHAGRLAGYAALGAVAGLVGHGLDLGGAALGLHRLRFLVSAMLLLLFGLAFLGVVPCRWLEPGTGAAVRLVTALRRRGGPYAWLLLGLPIGLLPCGLLYPMYALAAGSGSPARGALLLLAFGLGTVPLLGSVSLAFERLRVPARQRLLRGAGVVMLAMAAWMSWRGFTARPHMAGLSPGAPAAPTDTR
ncbi:MAG: sulfite exporter TauE/SafE family protein [Gemmatimonadales bacterium]